MGYIHEFESKLKELLSGVDEETRKEVLRVAKETVVESYHNGMTAAKMVEAEKDTERKARRFACGE